MAHVTRAICRALGLNADFAEGIALGSKIGAVPFIHAAKVPVAKWIVDRLGDLDGKGPVNEPLFEIQFKKKIEAEMKPTMLPYWLSQLKSQEVVEKVRKYIPWAGGSDKAYSAGQESYWLLSTNPYLREKSKSHFTPETMFGIWKHTREDDTFFKPFRHLCPIHSPTGLRTIESSHATYEGIVVQYADDITWAIENLNDANNAALLNKKGSIYSELSAHLGDKPTEIVLAIDSRDAGRFYTFFINDFVTHSKAVLTALNADVEGRAALREGAPKSLIGLSPDGARMLDSIIGFLKNGPFNELRVKHRAIMLEQVTRACLDLLFRGHAEGLDRFIDDASVLGVWHADEVNRAKSLLGDPVHRIQLTVDVFAEMGDQEIYDFVGIQSL
jgi:hypothetical protein